MGEEFIRENLCAIPHTAAVILLFKLLPITVHIFGSHSTFYYLLYLCDEIKYMHNRTTMVDDVGGSGGGGYNERTNEKKTDTYVRKSVLR